MNLATRIDPLVTRIDPRSGRSSRRSLATRIDPRRSSRRTGRGAQARHGAELLAACGTGAALAYLLDPAAGRRRRHTLRDRTIAVGRRRARSAARRASYEAGHLHGAARRAGGLVHHTTPEYDDVTLTQRVEGAIAKAHAVPLGTINVNARYGVVELRGAVESEKQIETIGKVAHKVEGVLRVENLLHVPGVPAPHARPARANGTGDELG